MSINQNSFLVCLWFFFSKTNGEAGTSLSKLIVSLSGAYPQVKVRLSEFGSAFLEVELVKHPGSITVVGIVLNQDGGGFELPLLAQSKTVP